MEPVRKSLESTSVKALVQISDEELQNDRHSPQRNTVYASTYSLPASEQPRALKRPQVASSRFSPSRSPVFTDRLKAVNRLRTQRSSITKSPSSYMRAYLDPFRPFAQNLVKSTRCKCVFIGGGGFIATNKNVPCEAPLCINRVSLKYQWRSEDDLKAKSPSKVEPTYRLEPQGFPATDSWLSITQKPRHASPYVECGALHSRIPHKLQRKVGRLFMGKSTLDLRLKLPKEEASSNAERLQEPSGDHCLGNCCELTLEVSRFD